MIDAYLQVGNIKGESQLGPELDSVIAGLARVTASMSKRWCA